MRRIWYSLLIFWGAAVQQPAWALERCSHYISAGRQDFFAYQASDELSKLSGEAICPRESQGSLENLSSLMNDPQVIASTVQEDIIRKAVLRNRDRMSSVAVIYPLARKMLHVIVRKDTGIQDLQQLAGKVVCIGSDGSGSLYTALQLKALTNNRWIDAREAFPQCLTLLNRGSVDAVMVLAQPPVTSLKNKIGAELKLLDVSGIPGYESDTISSYSVPDNPVSNTSIFVRSLLLVDDSKLQKNIRINNKLVIGAADYLSKMSTQEKDSICMQESNNAGLSLSRSHKELCSLGYFGQDW